MREVDKTSLAYDYAKRFAMSNSYNAHTQILGDMCRCSESMQREVKLRWIFYLFRFVDGSQIEIQSDAYDRVRKIKCTDEGAKNERD